jgi:hypothetical protein
MIDDYSVTQPGNRGVTCPLLANGRTLAGGIAIHYLVLIRCGSLLAALAMVGVPRLSRTLLCAPCGSLEGIRAGAT